MKGVIPGAQQRAQTHTVRQILFSKRQQYRQTDTLFQGSVLLNQRERNGIASAKQEYLVFISISSMSNIT